MHILVKVLQEKFANQEANPEKKEFPDYRNYSQIYDDIRKYIEKKYIENENLGAAARGSGVLTDHGVLHVNQVTESAAEILFAVEQLTGYEIFLLLLGILFHDIGNIQGREEHEKKIYDIINSERDHFSLQNHEMRIVCDIATAHGGHSESFGKDTIREVADDDDIGGITVRAKALAAIIRFADEISDDSNRAIQNGVEIPDENLIYHEYSKTLKPHSVNGETLSLSYEIPFEHTQKEINCNGKGRYLYDEILDRLTKCIIELEYCKKYDRGLIKISTISVTINVLQKDSFKILQGVTQSFRMTLQGYPAAENRKIEQYLQSEESHGNGLLYNSGKSLKEKVNSNVKS